jgi:hypothetical protein
MRGGPSYQPCYQTEMSSENKPYKHHCTSTSESACGVIELEVAGSSPASSKCTECLLMA